MLGEMARDLSERLWSVRCWSTARGDSAHGETHYRQLDNSSILDWDRKMRNLMLTTSNAAAMAFKFENVSAAVDSTVLSIAKFNG
jgi:hypothetical protein